MAENKVLATVEGKEITEEIVSRFLNELGPQVAMQFNNPEGKKRIIDELVNQELVYLEALEDGVDKNEDFLKELERLKEGLLKQYAVGKLFEDIDIDEKEVKDYYENNKAIFEKPETRVASHILVSEEEEAKNILEEIKEGLEFAEAAEKYSNCPSKAQGGSLGEFGKGQMVPEFEAATFNLEIDELSEPVKTEHGYHIIKVSEINEAGTRDFDEVKDDLEKQLIGMKQQEKYIEKTDKLKEKYEVVIK